jgi:hypothetical protein
MIDMSNNNIAQTMMSIFKKKFDTRLKGQVFSIEDLLNKHEDMRLSLDECIKYSSSVVSRKITPEQMRKLVIDDFDALTNKWPSYWVAQFQNGRTLTTDDFVDGETPEDKLINLSDLFIISPEIMTIKCARNLWFTNPDWTKNFALETIAFCSLDSLEKVYNLFRKQHEVTGMAVPVMQAVPTPEQNWRKFCLSEVV